MKLISIRLLGLLVLLECSYAQDLTSLLDRARTYDFGKDTQAIVALEQRILDESKSQPTRSSVARQLAVELRRPDSPPGFKQFVCRQLALVGSASEVPVLVELLGDLSLADMARYALARIDGPAVDIALRTNLASAKGRTLEGIIETIGQRGDADATEQLVGLLDSPDPAIQAAAASALGRIASPTAAEALRRRADNPASPLSDRLADACLGAAAKMVAGQSPQVDQLALSEQLLRTVFRRSISAQFKAAALRQLLVHGGKEELTLLVETLKRGDIELQRSIAAIVIPDLANPPQIDAVCALSAQLPPDVQMIVLSAFADYGSGTASVMTTIRQGMKSADPGVRLAAIDALASIGDSSDLEVLTGIALNGPPAEQQAARKALAILSSLDVNTRLAKILAAGDEKTQTLLVEVLGERQAREAAPQLLEIAKTRTGALASESLKALGMVGGTAELAELVQIMLAAGPELQETAVQAVVAISRRAESESECASTLAARYAETGLTVGTRQAVIRVLGRLGAAPGLPVILAGLKDPDSELSKEAVIAASGWPDAKPAPNLLAIARASTNPPQKVLALRGYLDLIERDGELSPDDKVSLYEASMAIADEGEKQRVFSKLGQLASFSALNLVLKLAGSPARDEAITAAISIAQKVYPENGGLARLIVRKMIESSRNDKLTAQCRDLLAQIEKAESGRAESFPAFRVVTINPDSRFEAAAMFDVNHDGRLDIYCGGFWYQAPNWSRHTVRQVAEQDNYFLDFGAIPQDIDGDGWTDVVSGSWHGKDVFWIKNHGATGGAFETIKIDQPGNLETLIGVDVNGDSRLDFLPNTVDAIHWYQSYHDANVASGARWVRHDLPGGVAGHGIGAGDINGDGRVDIISPKGWLEQPDKADVAWIWHPQFDLGSASVPILVYDVNGDHYPDLVWGNAHGYGLQWLEQIPIGEKTRWEKHPIDSTWSQPHFLLLADVDGDGTEEVVTGKRYHAHNGNDPGEDHPLCVYAYQYDQTTRLWKRHVLHEGGNVGFGISTMAGDIDKDGDIDLVAPGKSGLYLLENQLKK